MNIYKQLILAMAMLGTVITAIAAPEVSLHSSMSAKTFFVGEEFQFEILVSPADRVDIEEVESTDDLAIQFVKKEVVKGDAFSTVALRYRMMPMSAGMVAIPPISVEVGDQVLSTDEEMFIQVKQAQTYPGLEIVREIPDRDFYVGEPFMVDYTWRSPLPLNGFRAVKLNLPLFYDPAFKIRNPFDWIDGDDKAAIGLPVANTRLIGRYNLLNEAERNVHSVSFAKIVIPVKTGEFEWSPSTLLISYVAPPAARNRNARWRTNYPSYFNNNFFAEADGDEYQKYFAASSSQTVRVLPLPDAGKPHDFAGVVGSCKVTVTATPTVLQAGDPITLTIVVDDYAFPEVLDFPDLSSQPAFTRQFAIPPRQSSGRIVGKRKTYIRTLRPLAQDATSIPAVRIPYFDPQTKSYAVAESAPIPITVKAAEVVTAFDADMTGVGPLKNRLAKNPEGIRANATSLSAIRPAAFSPGAWLLLCLFLPPAAFLVFYFATAQRRLMQNDPVRARSMRAMARFSKRLRALEQAAPKLQPEQGIGRLDDIVRSYFAEKLNLVRHAHTFEELELQLGDRVSLDAIREIYGRCEAQAYRADSPTPDLSTMIAQARQAVQTINAALS
ncbi:BatD family protein [Verrucomicrobiaceae bacterium 5K15]|uniref:BatD family protein n=1 Tax=Oceaniferula flava TaxID=2800421 RepID=A0AAE2S9P2_9BACT|nr:BatD family protein [Oceaniferula flavus]MBK1854328.1 BatD family protein [Oceaniferula flavus]MBM1135634.1 BatD family protein [Oceaniferula flavus]